MLHSWPPRSPDMPHMIFVFLSGLFVVKTSSQSYPISKIVGTSFLQVSSGKKIVNVFALSVRWVLLWGLVYVKPLEKHFALSTPKWIYRRIERRKIFPNYMELTVILRRKTPA
ncbi:hypothetical protein CEXT_47611 [Caerostris extrusa]|uniref:Uncharacterized protein n=1 Tax=Caerostris extrusa TaxID=172846 RepID=A0AAV4M9C9_CAEEX|nr:hypothetical protein CEXT_47611 [Caerostris extrusa]